MRQPGLYLVLTPDLKIVAVSDAYLRATMTKPADIVGRALLDVSPDSSENLSPVLDATGELAYIIHRVEDVTEFVRLKTVGSELDTRAEEMEKELESLSYSVSHDLRAPLRVIDGFSLALLEDYGPTLPAEGQDLLARVRQQAQRIAHLIDGLLEFSRLGRKPLDVTSVDLAALAQVVVQELRQANAGRNVEVTVTPLPPAMGDRALLRQVLANLIGVQVHAAAPGCPDRNRLAR